MFFAQVNSRIFNPRERIHDHILHLPARTVLVGVCIIISMTYTEILKIGFSRLSKNEMESTEEIPPATPQEIQWRKGFQVIRALRHKRAGNPTTLDLNLIRAKTKIIVTNRDFKRALAKEC